MNTNMQVENSRPKSTDRVRVIIADEAVDYSVGLSAYLAEVPSVSVVAQVVQISTLLEAASASRPDVVVLDTAMQDCDPTETIRQLTSPEYGIGAQVMVLTSPNAQRPYSVDVDLRNSLAAGATSYLFKKQGYRGLVAAVHHTASDWSVLEPSLLRQLIRQPGFDEGAVTRAVETAARLGTLTSREMDVLSLMGRGLSNTEISEYFGTARATTKNHVSSILRKLGLRDRVQAAIVARDFGIEPSQSSLAGADINLVDTRVGKSDPDPQVSAML